MSSLGSSPRMTAIWAVVYKSVLVKLQSPVSLLIELFFPMGLLLGLAQVVTPAIRPVLMDLFHMLLFLSLSLSLSRLVYLVVAERESRMQEFMKILGLSNLALYWSWFAFYAGLMGLICASIAPVIVWGGIIGKESSIVLLFLFYWVFCTASISFSLLMSVPFENSRVAQTASFLIYFLVAQIESAVKDGGGSSVSWWRKILGILFPQIGFSMGNKIIAKNGGLDWNNVGELVSIIVSLGSGTVLFFISFWYLDQVVPRAVGFRKPWTFPFFFKQNPDDSDPLMGENTSPSSFVRVDHVTKQYSSSSAASSPALSDVSLSFPAGSVTVLLGQNGAGKTTLINILTGMIDPSAGKVRIFGNPVSTARESIGYCPQHDVLWPELTVVQHLSIFGRIKKIPSLDVSRQIDQLISLLGLTAREHVPVSHLSGGMKRRLCTAIAFLGKAKFVVLDEPSSGMDPFSRKQLWEAVGSLKSGRAVLLSTHYLDEAELVGDKIAILHKGVLRGEGRSTELKRKFNCGFELNVKGREVVGALQVHGGNEEFFSKTEQGISIQVPLAQVKQLSNILNAIEHTFPAHACTIATNRLEEVFMRICQQDDEEVIGPDSRNLPGYVPIHSVHVASRNKTVSVIDQTVAIVKYRFWLFVRQWRAELVQHLFPLAAIAIGGFMAASTEADNALTTGLMQCMLIGMAFSSVPGNVTSYLSKESELKNLMITHGLSMRSFWIGQFIADLAEYYVLSCGLSLTVLAMIGTTLNLGKLVLLLAVYGPAAIAHAYLLFVIIPNATLLQIVNTVLNMLIGSVLPIVAFIAENFAAQDSFTKIFLPACKTVPTFVFGEGMLRLIPGIEVLGPQDNGISESIGILVVLSVSCWVVTFAIDHMISVHALSRMKWGASHTPLPIDSEDETVVRERDFVASDRSQVLRLHSVSKQYSSCDPWAVDQVPLGIVPTGDVFGLLGQNSAGKSTLLKMCTGEILPTNGDVEYCKNQSSSYNTRRNMSACRKMIGYCPQADLVCKDLHVRDLLLFYARIKGMGIHQVLDISEQLELTEYLDAPAKTLSGGYLRRVSLGVALIGKPDICFLDEPSCGMDAVARRSIWKSIKNASVEGGSVIITTHSMEEAEAVSSRVGIMSKGRMVCMGSVEELREKFNNGVEIYMHIIDSGMDGDSTRLLSFGEFETACEHHSEKRLRKFRQSVFASDVSGETLARWWASENLLDLIEERVAALFGGVEGFSGSGRSVRFVALAHKGVTVTFLAEVFRNMGTLRNENLILDFGVTQNSLEQVFQAISSLANQ